jgi:protein N-terminal methyltransferase
MDGIPVVEDGLEYWKTQAASLDGVLGGFGSGVTRPFSDYCMNNRFSTVQSLSRFPESMRWDPASSF